MSFKKNYPLANEPSCRTVTQESTPNQAVSLTKSDDNWQLLDEVLQGSPVATFVIDTN
jgi:hypothetical protein